jgi:hypothetical protein
MYEESLMKGINVCLHRENMFLFSALLPCLPSHPEQKLIKSKKTTNATSVIIFNCDSFL